MTAAISRYIYIAVNPIVSHDYLLKYAAFERVGHINEIQHPIIREVFRQHAISPGIELVSLADIPSGTGLGSSGAFTVGLLRAVYAFKRAHTTPDLLAEEACHLEMELLGRPVGKQDQYAASLGGITALSIDRDGRVSTAPVAMSPAAIETLEDHLVMFFTGYSRSADALLGDQSVRSRAGDDALVQEMHHVKEMGVASRVALERGNWSEFASLLNAHWVAKRTRSQGMSNERIDHWYEVGIKHGAQGGKLVGAGGGGYLLFYADDRDELRSAMAREGLQEVRVRFDFDGSTIIVRD